MFWNTARALCTAIALGARTGAAAGLVAVVASSIAGGVGVWTIWQVLAVLVVALVGAGLVLAGVAQYGLYPDWIEDAAHVAGSSGVGLKEDMARGAEAYLQTWERALGVAPDACRNADLRLDVDAFRAAVTVGMTTREVLAAVGQPYERLGRTYTTCATAPGQPRARVAVDFSAAGEVTGVRRLG